MSPSSGRRLIAWLVTATLVTCLAWAWLIPPFEGPDESAFYKGLIDAAHGRVTGGPSLYAIVMKPALRLAGGQDRPFEGRYNPAFRFISNQRGRVNMYMHGRSNGFIRADVNRMYVVRVLTVCLWLVTLLLVFDTARMFFGQPHLAFLTAMLVLALPQFSFFSSKIHAEATTVLLASAAYWVVAARVCGRVGRTFLWIAGAGIMALAPLSDRQAYFLLLFVPFSLVATETTWRTAARAFTVMVVPATVGLTILARGSLQRDVSTWIAPLLPSYRNGWWNVDTMQYLAFEFAPKQMLGFFGWLGQPSILLPAPVYAAFIVGVGLGLGGLFTGDASTRWTRVQRRLVWIGAAGLLLAIAPILYTNILIARSTTGRWLYPSVTLIMIAVVAGWQRLAAAIRQRRRRIAAVLAIVAVVLAAIWLTPPGGTVRAGMHANHYGDADHLIRTVTWSLVLLAAAAAAIEVSRAIRRPQWLTRERPVFWLAGTAWALNLLLLVVFVVPLYRPLDADAFAAAVRAEIAEAQYGRGSALYRIGVAAYPESPTLRRIESEEPLLVLGGGDDMLLASLRARIGRGEKLDSRAELNALARVVATKRWLERDMLDQVVQHSADRPELREPLAVIRAQAEGRQQDASAAAGVVRAAAGALVPLDMHGEATLEGYTVNPGSGGRNEVTVYFTPRRDWSRRQLWVHAYPQGSDDYLVLEPAPPAFQGWKTGELSWETFPLPSNDRYTLYVGVEIAGNLGPPFPLGAVGTPHP